MQMPLGWFTPTGVLNYQGAVRDVFGEMELHAHPVAACAGWHGAQYGQQMSNWVLL